MKHIVTRHYYYILTLLLMPFCSRGCTGIKLIADNGAITYGRTMEFARVIAPEIASIPAQYAIPRTHLNQDTKAQWNSHYATLGMYESSGDFFIDGINEAGLAAGFFYLPETTYQEASSDSTLALAPWELVTWILTTCGCIDDVTERLPHITVTNTIFEPWGIVIPLHVIVHDASGASLVIEYIGGKLQMHRHPLGIITNSPPLAWHMANLKNYLKLSPHSVESPLQNRLNLTPMGPGSGLVGLPGDFTPTSRFIRAAMLCLHATDKATEQDAVKTAFKILNQFDIPKGIILEHRNGLVLDVYTQWTTVADLHNKLYYVHTYNNRQLQCADFAQHVDNVNVTRFTLDSRNSP